MSSHQQHPDSPAYPPYNQQQQPENQQNPNSYAYASPAPPQPGAAPLLRFDERTGRYVDPADAEMNSQAQWGGVDAHVQGGYGAYASGNAGEGARRHQEEDAAPTLPPRRAGTDAVLPQGADRSHQVEVMQSYEMSRPQTEDEQNQAILQREFPKLDSSLIAAIYGDSGSLSATREMLQELSGGE